MISRRAVTITALGVLLELLAWPTARATQPAPSVNPAISKERPLCTQEQRLAVRPGRIPGCRTVRLPQRRAFRSLLRAPWFPFAN